MKIRRLGFGWGIFIALLVGTCGIAKTDFGDGFGVQWRRPQNRSNRSSPCNRNFNRPSSAARVEVFVGDLSLPSLSAQVLGDQVFQIGQALDHETAEAIHWTEEYLRDPGKIGGDLLRGYDPASVVFILTAGAQSGTSVPGFDGVIAKRLPSESGSLVIEPIARVSLKSTLGNFDHYVDEDFLLKKGVTKADKFVQWTNWMAYVDGLLPADQHDFSVLARILAIGVDAVPSTIVLSAPNDTIDELRSDCGFVNRYIQIIRERLNKISDMAQILLLGSRDSLLLEANSVCQ